MTIVVITVAVHFCKVIPSCSLQGKDFPDNSQPPIGKDEAYNVFLHNIT